MTDKKIKCVYNTNYGRCFSAKIEDFISSQYFNDYKGKISLIFTSPPFPLNRKKKYGNLSGKDYVDWLTSITTELKKLLKRNGSLVIELGNSWEPGLPVMSTLSLKTLIAVQESGSYYVCQNFVWYNKAKLPTPAQWVNIKRIRVKDSFTNIWWLAKTSNPKANNKNVLVPYSEAMKDLLKNGKYNSGIRPSEHNIGAKTFLKNNSGAIPSNVLIGANTHSTQLYKIL